MADSMRRRSVLASLYTTFRSTSSFWAISAGLSPAINPSIMMPRLLSSAVALFVMFMSTFSHSAEVVKTNGSCINPANASISSDPFLSRYLFSTNLDSLLVKLLITLARYFVRSGSLAGFHFRLPSNTKRSARWTTSCGSRHLRRRYPRASRFSVKEIRPLYISSHSDSLISLSRARMSSDGGMQIRWLPVSLIGPAWTAEKNRVAPDRTGCKARTGRNHHL